MAATYNVWHYVECLITTGKKWAQGSRGTPVAITLTEDDGYDNVVTVATATTVTIWDVSSSIITGFEACNITTDKDIFVVLIGDKDGSVGIMRWAQLVRANTTYSLTSDVMKANFTTDVSTGTNDFIETIQIRNESGTSAKVAYNIVN